MAGYGVDSTQGCNPNPGAVALPVSTQEVSALLKTCYQLNIPVVPSGGRTGYAKGAAAEHGELVVSLEKMNKVISVDNAIPSAHVQAGVIIDQLNVQLIRENLYYPVSFAASGSAQIGGSIATNAGGIHVLRYGSTRQHVLEVTVVDGTGQVHTLGSNLVKDNTGYDLKQLFIGAEGTLGIITEARVKLTSPPGLRQTACLGLSRFSELLGLLSKARLLGRLHAFEILHRRCLDLVLQSNSHVQDPFQEQQSWYAVIDWELDQPDPLFPLAEDYDNVIVAQNSEHSKSLWRCREHISEALRTQRKIVKFDISLSPLKMDDFLAAIESHLSTNYPASELFVFGHLGDGNLHINIVVPASFNEQQSSVFRSEMDMFMVSQIKKFAGSISAEHGIGLLKKEQLASLKDPDQLKMMKQIKMIFDPGGILNPGKVFDKEI
jgi:FAD/FMN-containing dehydrogenase